MPTDAVFRRAIAELRSCAEQGARPGSVERQLLDLALALVEGSARVTAAGGVSGLRRLAATGRGPAGVELELAMSRATTLLGETMRVWTAAAGAGDRLPAVTRTIEELAADLRVRAAAAADRLQEHVDEIERSRRRAEELAARLGAAAADGGRLTEEVAALERQLEEETRRVANTSEERARVLDLLGQVERLRVQFRQADDVSARLQATVAELKARRREIEHSNTVMEAEIGAERHDLAQAEARLQATRALLAALRDDPRSEIRRAVQRVWDALPLDQFDRVIRESTSVPTSSTTVVRTKP